MFKVAAFYKFSKLPDFGQLQAPLLAVVKSHQITGLILLAAEGINGTIAGLPDQLHAALEEISKLTGIATLEPKYSFAQTKPFRRMKVRLKKEIVTIGNVKADPTELVGSYVPAEEWNALIHDPDILLIDTRNAFEVGIGTFKGAIDPHTDNFGEFPKYVRDHLGHQKHRKIAMFCTGGIRCEKASSFMLNEGFENVFHLKGGILKYLEVVPETESAWTGACFVFDERVAVEHGLKLSDYTICHGCTNPVSAENREDVKYERGVSCPACFYKLTPDQLASNRERQRQVDLAEQRGERHLGPR